VNHLWRVLLALSNHALFLFSLFLVYGYTGRILTVLFTIGAYAGCAIVRRRKVRWLGYAWVATFAGIVGLSQASVDLRLSPTSPPGMSLEQNGWAYMSTFNYATGERTLSDEPVSWGNQGCFVEYNAAKWHLVVGLGQEYDWVERAARERLLLKWDYQLWEIDNGDWPLPRLRYVFEVITAGSRS